mmetsp:Transcript_15923/g.60676  ORF Transcript_15923/g.60676 Transcript_15923/m.60676 type:complete len:229 (-) Transcript_15923:69-755(-)
MRTDPLDLRPHENSLGEDPDLHGRIAELGPDQVHQNLDESEAASDGRSRDGELLRLAANFHVAKSEDPEEGIGESTTCGAVEHAEVAEEDRLQRIIWKVARDLKGEHDSGEEDKVDADEDDFRLLIAIRILDVGHGQGRNACQEDGASDEEEPQHVLHPECGLPVIRCAETVDAVHAAASAKAAVRLPSEGLLRRLSAGESATRRLRRRPGRRGGLWRRSARRRRLKP